MALARRHEIGLEMAVYRLAVLIGKNRSEAGSKQKNPCGNELEQPFHNLLLFVLSNLIAQLRSGFSVSPWKCRLLLGDSVIPSCQANAFSHWLALETSRSSLNARIRLRMADAQGNICRRQ